MASTDMVEARSDAELLCAALAGEEPAFLVLYEKLKGGIFRYAVYMTGSITAAEEVTQEAFMALLKEGRKYREERGDVGAFVFGFVRNFVRRARRERAYEPLPDDETIQRMAASLVIEPEALQRRMIRNQAAEQVRAAVRSLPEHYAQVIVLCDLCEFSYVEAASRLGCAVGTVRSRLNRAHNLLAKKLKPLRDGNAAIRAAGAEGCLI
ncbi:MAG TPA: RNA polymerase sigma factor [Terriglobales bacterium]|nr:RNA polymerase sigma factor [Terriglobales bacterium]